jgi:hypothetical protein
MFGHSNFSKTIKNKVFISSRSNVPQKESSIHSLEDEYIKQLQEQIYHLENECQYLYPFSISIYFKN